MNDDYNLIEQDILKSFYNLKKKVLKNSSYYDVIRNEWLKEDSQEKLILKSVSKPKFLKKLFYLVADENFWKEVGESNLVMDEKDKKLFIELIYLFNGLQPRDLRMDMLIEEFRENIRNLEFNLQDSKINYKLITQTEEGINKHRDRILSVLKDAREYLEAISIIWKWNEIRDIDETFNVNNFTLHGFHKIIKGKLQSTRNRWSTITNKNKQEKKSVFQIQIHPFLKPNDLYNDSGKKISTLSTRFINEELKKEGYATSINLSHFSNCNLAEKVIQLKTSSKKDFQSLINDIDFLKVKILSFGKNAHEHLLPRIKKDLENKESIIKNIPYGFLLSHGNFFWPDSPNTKIYESINVLSKYNKFFIDKRFLDTRTQIKDFESLEAFYDTKKKEEFINLRKDKKYVSDPNQAYRSLYEDNKEDFKKVLEAIDNIEEELRGLDQIIITCRARSGKKLPYISNLLTIVKHINGLPSESNSIISTCIILDDVKDMEVELKKEWIEENDIAIEEIKKESDSFIRFDRQKFIESREGPIDSVEQKMRLYRKFSKSLEFEDYEEKIANLIDNELIDILNNILVIYCKYFHKISIEDYRDFMQGGATILGKYTISKEDYDNKNIIKIEREIEKKYDYLLFDKYKQLGEYNSYGRLMILNSMNSIDTRMKADLDEAKIFGNNKSITFLDDSELDNPTFDKKDVYLTLTFLQT
jgi:hypothetical protein